MLVRRRVLIAALMTLCLGVAVRPALSSTARITLKPAAGPPTSTVPRTRLAPSPLWDMQYDSGGTDYPEGMVVSPDGSTAFVTGYSVLPDYSTDFATIAYDARTGAQRWVAGYDDPSNSDDSPLAIAASPDGSSVFVTGLSTGATTSWDLTTISYDAVTGEQRWLATYSGPGSEIDVGTVLGMSPDGQTVFVTGRTDVGSISDAITVAYDAATGAQRWMDVWPGPEGTGYYALDQGISPDGSKGDCCIG